MTERVYTKMYGAQTSASGEAQSEERRYERHLGESGRMWFVWDSNPDAVYCTDSKFYDRAGEGFTGRTITLKLKPGFEYEGADSFDLKGGWQAGSQALYDDTGVDIRDLHATQILIGLKRGFEDGQWHKEYFEDVVYQEHTPMIGTFNRHEELSQRIADEQGRPVYVSMKSSSGGVGYCKCPTGTTHSDWVFDKEAGTVTRKEPSQA